jgi:sigma-B regulation protein RsbU (phosphoserine phosphatase)
MKAVPPVVLRDTDDLYQNAPCGLVSFFMKGNILTVNNTLLKWLDISEASVTKLSFTDLIDKGGKFYYQLFVQPMLDLHGEVNEINISLNTPTGSIPCLLNASVSKSSTGTEKVVHAAIFKMRDRKKYEVELLNKKLQAEREKQQKSSALEEVAFDQSHLVRVPLANILGLISLVESSALNDDTRQLFDLIKQSSLQLDTEVRKIVEKTIRY